MHQTPLTIEYALLGLLYQRPRHGYEIYQQLLTEEGLGLVWQLKQSQLYALFVKLEQQGYIAVTLEPQDVRPPRKILQLTATGREAFLNWLRMPVAQGRKMRMEFMAKLYCAHRLGPTAVVTLIDNQRDACREWLASLQNRADALSSEHSYEWLVNQFRIGQTEAMINWLDLCRQTVAPAT